MWKWRNKEIIMERYFVTNQNMIYKKNKYEIGKRYKIIQNIIEEDFPFYDSLKEISNKIIYNLDFKIFIVKIYTGPLYRYHSFKILKEIDYKIAYNDESSKIKEFILAIKTRNEKILKDFLDSRMVVESQIAINCGMADYAISHGLYKNNPCILKALANLGRNLILNLINDVSIVKKHNLLHILSKHGRPQDLNFLLKMFSNNLIVISIVCKNGRKKDMIYGLDLIKNKNSYDNQDANLFFETIIETGIDWILDNVMNNSEIKKKINILMDIVKQGRKKDIDEIIKIKKLPLYLFQTIADVGFDEHLKILKNHENSLVSEYVSSYELSTI